MAKAEHAQRAVNKRRDIELQIAVLERAAAVHPQTGGLTFAEIEPQLEFQQWRRSVALWAGKNSKAAVQTRLAEVLAVLTPEERACMGGDARTLGWEAYRAVCEAELLMIALGTNPGGEE